ncbi:MAG: polymerase subunit sigma-24 [Sphaerisporangium sp.]|nr:polymerase subunit sigma-24 [Sphaerisporangium sp.]
MTSWDAHRAIDAVWKLESARIIAGLVRMVSDVGLAEELAQDALLAALEQWPESGVPDNPGAWLMAVAKRRAIDHLRRGERLDRRHEQLAHELATQQDTSEPDMDADLDDEVGDDVLRLMFISCHPALSTESRVALTLRLLGGLRTDEIARAFLVSEPAVAQRIVRAKRALAAMRIPFEVPSEPERAARLSSVLEVIYLVFNEGYAATAGDEWMRPSLCFEALRLGRVLAELAPDEAEVHGLVALMELQASRSATRTGPSGEPIPLLDQNRGRWDQLLIHRGFAALLRAREAGGPLGPYVLQAAVAVCHARARTAQETDWTRIAALYESLVRVLPTPVVQLNRAVALAMAYGPEAGLALADTLTSEPALKGYHLLPSVRGDLLAKLGRHGEAQAEFERAASLTGNTPERTILLKRAAACEEATQRRATTPRAAVTLAEAVSAFLTRGDLDAGTIRSYGHTMGRLRRHLGDDTALPDVTACQVSEVFATAWGQAAPATWNRHRAAIRSFVSWAAGQDRGWITGDLADRLDRRPESRARTQPIERPCIEALWERRDVAPRERALWLLLYESAARADWVLSLDVEDLDLAGMRGKVTAKTRWVYWQSGSARLLPGVIAGRRRGPLFLADRRPGPARTLATGDLCPETGRGRLSYERAEYLFKQATKDLDREGHGYTLHQLRHSRLTHLGEDGWSAPMLMNLSGHDSVRSLSVYGAAAVPHSR